jgi:glucose-6-phosphate 1-dehydrogenase
MGDHKRTSIVIFGASGDLTQRKLIPSLFNLFRKGRLREPFRIIGHSNSDFSDVAFRRHLAGGLREHAAFKYQTGEWKDFETHIHYHRAGYTNIEDFRGLADILKADEGANDNRLFYMATPPGLFPDIISQLGATGQLEERAGWRRVVIEKPFGTDLESAQRLNLQIHEQLRERQAYRIDHYLGKETVQNILVTRFANTIFEPLWNRNYIDHVQITVAEQVGLEHRAGYYDNVGVLRDMFQNHLLQLVALVAMEPPASFDAVALRNEKVKVLASIQPLEKDAVASDTVRAQYRGYLDEPGVKPDSNTPTFAAVRFQIDNWRWQGVPFYLRSGKRLAEKLSHVAIEFKRPPHNLFRGSEGEIRPDVLMLFLQPDEGIHWRFEAKVPDSIFDMRSVNMQFHYAESFEDVEIPDSYERLLLDALAGDASLFTRADEVETAWGLIDPIIRAWASGEQPPLSTYQPGSWGPSEAEALLSRDGRTWMNRAPGDDHP